MEQMPEVIDNDYLVIRTLDRAVWKCETQQNMAVHDFKEVVTLHLQGLE